MYSQHFVGKSMDLEIQSGYSSFVQWQYWDHPEFFTMYCAGQEL